MLGKNVFNLYAAFKTYTTFFTKSRTISEDQRTLNFKMCFHIF